MCIFFSPLFFRALSRWSSDGRSPHTIPGISPAAMELIIQYASGSLDIVTPENVQELLEAGDQFEIMGLVQDCCSYLEEQMSLENCAAIWRLLKIYHHCSPSLKHKAFSFILQHFEEMVRVSEDFQQLSLQELVEILESDQLNVKYEAVVFETIVRWISYSITERLACMSVLLPKVK